VLCAIAIFVCASRSAHARDTLVLGGSTSSAYVHSQGVLLEDERHDAHFKVGGLLGYQLQRPSLDLTTSLFAGGQISTVSDNLRQPVAHLNVENEWRAARGLDLAAGVTAELEPLSVEGHIPGVGGGTVVPDERLAGAPSLALTPELEASLDLSQLLRLETGLGADTLVLFKDPAELDADTVTSAYGVQFHTGLETAVSRLHRLHVRVLGRLMGANTENPDYPPTTGLAGGMVGYGYTIRDGWLATRLLAGVARVLNYDDSHLWVVEPLVNLEVSLNPRHNDAFTLTYRMRPQENRYYVGLPERVMEAQLGWTRAPTHRPWYARVELAYEHSHYGLTTFNDGAPSVLPGVEAVRDTETLHVFRVRSRLTWRLARSWRLFGAAELAVGARTLHYTPPVTPGLPPPDPETSGLFVRSLVGLAYIHAERPRDERLLREVW
jgi:hypothetical protein